MKTLFLSVMMMLFSLAYASDSVGSFAKIEGVVKLQKDGSIKKVNANVGDALAYGDLVTTLKDATAVLKLSDGSSLVLDPSSSVHFPKENLVAQQEGKIFYKITSKNAQNALQVQTPFAIIGIKGTTFIVKSDESAQEVKLKEGVVGIASMKEEFELYKKQVQTEYENFVKEQMGGFEAYKKAQNEAVAIMVKEFDLQSGNSLSFDGQKVKESGWSQEDDAEFARFEALMDSVLHE